MPQIKESEITATNISVGLKTALVLTGVTTPDELALSPLQPDFVFNGLPDLMASWDANPPNTEMGL